MKKGALIGSFFFAVAADFETGGDFIKKENKRRTKGRF